MSWIYCYDCESFFDEEDAKTRLAVPEDSVPMGSYVACCPNCGSSELEEANVCKICGNPIKPDVTDFCRPCTEFLDDGVQSLINHISGDSLAARDVFMDYLERRWL